jgi:RNA polymerase subunit RPABC4/transcription elongation factor Spt4
VSRRRAVSLWTLVALQDGNPFDAFSDFFTSGTWRLIVLLGWFLLGLLWLACAFWVFKDARRRIEDRVILVVAVLTGLVFGPMGAIVYAIVRPPEYLSDVRERELEMEVMERRLAEMQVCPHCHADVREDYLVCPNCTARLRGVCRTCRRPIEPGWRICPYCETQIGPAPDQTYQSAAR